jgi:4-hydroxy-3-methylbut-2-enyl diphosphate reductase
VKILIAEETGFCFGVKRAMKATERFVGQGCDGNYKVYTFGPLIHNPQVIDRLQRKRVVVAGQFTEIEGGTVIVRTHGIAPQRQYQ